MRPDKALLFMMDPVEALVLDLLEWIGPHPRPYAEVLDAWCTSCPRLPVWETANERGFVAHQHLERVGATVSVTPDGLAWLSRNGRAASWCSTPPHGPPNELHRAARSGSSA
jgi:hypothetical protein